MGKRKKKQAARRRGLTTDQRLRQRARARAELLYDPDTDPQLAAEILRELFGERPVDLDTAAAIGARGGLDRLRAVSEAVLARGHDPAALSLAADVALLDGRAEDAERHASQALGLLDDPELHVRHAWALAGQGHVAAAIDVLDAVLRADPGLGAIQLVRGELLQRAEPEVVERFLDRTSFEELLSAAAEFIGASEDRTIAVADGLQHWIEAGAISEEELTSWTEVAAADPGSPEAWRLRLIGEWAWQAGVDEPTPLEAFAADESVPAELRRRANDWLEWAFWGLWEAADPAGGPGVVLTDLVTGARVHGEVPGELLAGRPRWSVLLGYLVPVDGVWRMSSAFDVATPVEARLLLHELLDEVMAGADELGKEGRPMVSWAHRVHEDLGPLWLPHAAERPSPEAMAGLRYAVRQFAPRVAGLLRSMRGLSPLVGETFELKVADSDAAWEALAEHEDFGPDEDGEGLVWGVAGAEDEVRAYLARTDAGEILLETEHDEVPAVLDVLRGLGHPATAEEAHEEPPVPPVTLPDLPAAELPAWLEAWPDAPLDLMEEITPRAAVDEYGATAEIEMLVRYLEHDADQRGLRELDTQALREELGLETQ